jgi:DNA-binding MarR family transcriptional regulator
VDTDLDNFAFLIGDTARILRGRFDFYAREAGVTRAQWLVLVMLMRNEGATQTRIAELLEVEPISLSRMADRLEAAGYIERCLNARDRRVRELRLTPEGHDLLKKLRLLGAQVMAEASKNVTPEDLEQFATTMRKFRSNLVAAGEMSK